jgi:hypothetical protein
VTTRSGASTPPAQYWAGFATPASPAKSRMPRAARLSTNARKWRNILSSLSATDPSTIPCRCKPRPLLAKSIVVTPAFAVRASSAAFAPRMDPIAVHRTSRARASRDGARAEGVGARSRGRPIPLSSFPSSFNAEISCVPNGIRTDLQRFRKQDAERELGYYHREIVKEGWVPLVPSRSA